MASKQFFLVLTLFTISSCAKNIGDLSKPIVGGDIAPPRFATFAASLQLGTLIKAHFCGGALITLTHVLTAAHCVDAVWNATTETLSNSFEILVGTQDQNSGGMKMPVSGNFTHPEWNLATLKNDIAIVILKSPVNLTDNISLVKLNPTYIDGGIQALAVGWGRTSNTATVPTDKMKRLTTFTLSHKDCVARRDEIDANSTTSYPLISEKELCTFANLGEGACNMDSGGPLYTSQGLIGVVSWGSTVCGDEFPDVFVRYTAFRDWVTE